MTLPTYVTGPRSRGSESQEVEAKEAEVLDASSLGERQSDIKEVVRAVVSGRRLPGPWS